MHVVSSRVTNPLIERDIAMQPPRFQWLRQDLGPWASTALMTAGALALRFLLSAVLITGLLYLGAGLWHLYMETPVGRQYARSFPYITHSIQGIVDYYPHYLASSSALVVLETCLLFSLVGRFFLYARYLYDYRGRAARNVFWTLPASIVSAYCLYTTSDLDFAAAAALVIIPILLMLPVSIRLLSHLIPEIDSTWGMFVSRTGARVGEPGSGAEGPRDGDHGGRKTVVSDR